MDGVNIRIALTEVFWTGKGQRNSSQVIENDVTMFQELRSQNFSPTYGQVDSEMTHQVYEYEGKQ